MGVKYIEATHRRFAPEKLKEGRNIIGLQVSFTWPSSTSHVGLKGESSASRE
jgi:hypothetical protein